MNLGFLLFAIVPCLLPNLIVVFWQKKPLAAFIVASCSTIALINIGALIIALQTALLYGTNDLSLFINIMGKGLLKAYPFLPILLVILALTQQLSGYFYKKKNAQPRS